jgi:hypothetical protein
MDELGTTLTFSALDEIARATVRGRIRPDAVLKDMEAERLGPLIELFIMGKSGLLPAGSVHMCSQVAALVEELSDGHGRGTFLNREERNVGFIVTNRDANDANDSMRWTNFRYKALAAAKRWMPEKIAQGLIGAMSELEENIHLHSGCARQGIVAFRGTDQEFEFIVGDGGMGILASLRTSPEYAELTDSGRALELALSEGVSRLNYMEPGRGLGFRNLFRNLANINGELRFRSDDQAVTAISAGPEVVKRETRQKPPLQGFVSSIVCRSRPA